MTLIYLLLNNQIIPKLEFIKIKNKKRTLAISIMERYDIKKLNRLT